MSLQWNYDELWDYVSEHFHCGPYSIHGPSHWTRVKENGLAVAKFSGANARVVALFALFHDSCRESDGWDPGHGQRGAELARQLRSEKFDIPDEEFELLSYACQWHTDQKFHDDATIGTCWDADRLDLGRVGAVPDAAYLNTSAAKYVANQGGTIALLEDLEQDFFETFRSPDA